MNSQLILPGFEHTRQQIFHFIVMTFPPLAGAQYLTHLTHHFRAQIGLTGRPRPTHHLHTSLHSFGQTTFLPPRFLEVTQPIEKEFSFPRFDVTFDQILSFEKTGRPSPLVLLAEPESRTLLYNLYHAVGTAIGKASHGIFPFPEAFNPHVTLLYDWKSIGKQAIEPVSWPVTEFRLVISVVGQTRYIHVIRWHLTG